MYLPSDFAELSQERRFFRFLHPVILARILLVSIRRGGFRLSKIDEKATITRHSGVKYRQL